MDVLVPVRAALLMVDAEGVPELVRRDGQGPTALAEVEGLAFTRRKPKRHTLIAVAAARRRLHHDGGGTPQAHLVVRGRHLREPHARHLVLDVLYRLADRGDRVGAGVGVEAILDVSRAALMRPEFS